MSRRMAWWWARAVVVAVLAGVLIAGCTVWVVTAERPGPPDPAANLPAGATLVYTSKHYDYPIRTFQLAGCMFTEFYEYGEWELADRAFLGYDPAIDCEPTP